MNRSIGFVVLCLAFVLPAGVFVTPVAAEEIWVAPTHFTAPGFTTFPWPTTGRGFVMLSFAVPDDFESFDSAAVVLLPTTNVNGTYDVYANVKRDGESAAPGTVFNLGIPAALTGGVIEDLDITSLLAGQLDATSAGTDYVSVFFWFPASPGLDRATVLGMRFRYTPKPISSAGIAPGAITSVELAGNSVDGTKLASDSVDSSKVADDSLSATDIGPDAIGSSELAPDSVTTSHIVNGTITGADIASSSIGAEDLAAPAGADWVSGFQILELSGQVETVRSVTVTAPAPGFVVVNTSAALQFNGVAGSLRCSLTTGTALDFNHLITETGTSSGSIAGTRGFVVAAGDTTFNLVCQEFGGDIDLLHASVTAIYAPTRP